NYGRDHHPRNFTMWLAGGGIKPGIVYGETDDFSYNAVDKPIHIHDLNATILACLGIDHERLTYRYQGRDLRLTDVHGTVVKDLLAEERGTEAEFSRDAHQLFLGFRKRGIMMSILQPTEKKAAADAYRLACR